MLAMGLEEADARDSERWQRVVHEAKYQPGYKWPWL